MKICRNTPCVWRNCRSWRWPDGTFPGFGEPETDVEAEEQEPVNSYLLHEVLPLLELGLYPRLVDIDYDEFECYDPAALLGYIEESGRRMWNHGELIRSIRKIPPTCRAAFV